MKKAVVLFSGGQDSTTCLFWALKKFGTGNVIAIGFDYGQKHKVELEQAKKIAELVSVDYRVFSTEGLLGGSSLTEHGDTNEPHKVNSNLPSSFTAGRNMLFLTIAAQFAYEEGIRDIVTGVCQTDYSGYPDCRRNFINSMEVSLGLAMDTDFRIYTPLMYLTKAGTWGLANELSDLHQKDSWDLKAYKIEGVLEDKGSIYFNTVKIIRDLTLTDYNGDNQTMNEWGLGKEDNPASILRAKGFREAKELGLI